MIIFAGLVIGAAVGWRNARKQNGDRLDQIQYATVGAIIGSILGLVGTIVLERTL